MIKALDINGTEIKRDSLVKIVKEPEVSHAWLKEGNTLRVVNWENRNWFGEGRYVIVFLKSKKSGMHCRTGVLDERLEVIE